MLKLLLSRPEGHVVREDCATFSRGAIQALLNSSRIYDAAGSRSANVRAEWRKHGVTRPTVQGFFQYGPRGPKGP